MSPLAGLDAHAQRLAGTSLASLIEDDPARARDFSLRVGPLYANFARQRYDRLALDAMFDVAGKLDLATAMRAQLDGGIVNPTEGRAALSSGGGDWLASHPSNDQRLADIRERGVEVIELSEAERAAFAAATAGVQEKWAPRIGEALMDAARQAVAQP